MSSYTQLYLHCVWATWDRLPLITSNLEPVVYAAIGQKCKDLRCTPIAIGGVADHVHLLAQFPATLPIARLVGEVKGASSHAIAQRFRPDSFFKWQGAYGAFTVSKRSIDIVRAYVLGQKQRHARGALINELEYTDDPETLSRE